MNDLNAAAERERDMLRSYDGDDTPFEAVHAQIREGVMRAAEEIRQHNLKAAHQIMAAAAQRAAGRLNSELKELCDVRARAERAEADLATARGKLEKLVAKLTAIEADSSFQGIWGFLHAHGYQYAGPDWRDDLADARAFLERTASGPNIPQPETER